LMVKRYNLRKGCCREEVGNERLTGGIRSKS
jgi:hypothetical protein